MRNARTQKLQWSGPTVHSSTVSGALTISVADIQQQCGMKQLP